MYTFGGKYKLEEEIGYGGCGTVFLGVHTIAGKEVAIKVESAHQKHSLIKRESKIYKTLMGGPGVPWLMWSGKHGDYNAMVIDLLGPSLEDLFRTCNRSFSLKTVLLLADQLLSLIEYIHSRELVHRDIKPANFLMGPDAFSSAYSSSANKVNVIDFGFAKKYANPRTKEHIPYSQCESHGVGTPLFASINSHRGEECSRRDDLESLAYMFIYFLRGTLPWRRLKPPNDENNAPEENNPRLTWDRILKVKLAYEEATFRAAKLPYPSYATDDLGSSSKSNTAPSMTPQRSGMPPAETPKSSPLRKRKSTSLAQSTPAALHFPQSTLPPMTPEDHPLPQFSTKIPSSSQSAFASPSTPRKHHNKPRVQSLAQHLPPEFMVFYTYVRTLSFDSMPDYSGCRKMFRDLAKREGIKYDGQFDWCVGTPPPPSASSSAHNRRASTGSNMTNLNMTNNDGNKGATAGGSNGHAAGKHMRRSSGYMRKRFCTACAAIEAEKERVAMMESQHRQHHHHGGGS